MTITPIILLQRYLISEFVMNDSKKKPVFPFICKHTHTHTDIHTQIQNTYMDKCMNTCDLSPDGIP